MNSERKIIILAFGMMLLHMVDFMLITPLAPFFISSLHTPVSMIGPLVGGYTLCSAISGIIFSRFVDKIKRKPAIIVALLGLALSTMLTACAWDTSSLLLFRFIAGIFGGPVAALATTIITDSIPPQRRGKAMGILMSAFSISSAVALPLGLLIAANFSWHFAFIAIGLLLMGLMLYAACAFTSFQQTIAHAHVVGTPTLLQNKIVWVVLITLGISMGTLFALVPNLANFFVLNRHISPNHLALLYLCGGVASFVGGIGGGRLSDKIGPTAVCTLGTVLIVIGLIAGINFTLISAEIFYVLVMGGASLRMTSFMTQMSEIPQPNQRGAFMSLQNSARSLMMAVGSGASGLFLSQSASGALVGMNTIAILAIVGSIVVPLMMIYIGAYLQKRGKLY